MTAPDHEVERFEPGTRQTANQIIVAEMFHRRDGQWVRYSDYEKLKEERDAIASGKLPREHSVIRVQEAEAERDQAKAQALAEVRETLLTEVKRIELQGDIPHRVVEAALSTLEDTQREDRG